MRQLGRYRWFASLDNKQLPSSSRGVFEGAIELRRHFHNWLVLACNKDELLDLDGPTYFLDREGIPTRLFRNQVNRKLYRGWDHKRKKLNEFYHYLYKIYHLGYMSKLKPGQNLDPYFWANASVHLLLFALFTGVLIVLYTRKHGVCQTSLFEFRSDVGLVQIHGDVPGFLPPCRRAVLLHYNGYSHYEAVDLQENIKYSALPAPTESMTEQATELTKRLNREMSCRRHREAIKCKKDKIIQRKNFLNALNAASVTPNIKLESNSRPPVSIQLQPAPESFLRGDSPIKSGAQMKSSPELLYSLPDAVQSNSNNKSPAQPDTVPSSNSNVARMPSELNLS